MISELDNLQNSWDVIKQNVINDAPKSKEAVLLRANLIYPVEIYKDTIKLGVKNQFNMGCFEDGGILFDKIIKHLNKQVNFKVILVKYFTEEEELNAKEKQKKDELDEIDRLKEEKEREEFRNLEYRKAHSRIPAHAFEDERFEDLEVTPENKDIIDKCKNFVNNDKRNYWFLTLSGKTGTSKTHLMFAIAVESVRFRDVQYWHCGDLLDIFQRGQFDQTYFEVIDELKSIPLLVLDDYGDFKESAFKTEKLDILIDCRYENRLDTILTTNKSLKELIAMNQRIASRLMENLFIQTKGEDYRVKLSKNKIDCGDSKPLIRGTYKTKIGGW